MHLYLLIVVHGFRQLEKHDVVKKTKDRPTGGTFCPWNEKFYGAVKVSLLVPKMSKCLRA